MGIPGIFPTRNKDTNENTVQFSGSLLFQSTLQRDISAAGVDIGEAGSPFRTLYVRSIVADSISGEALAGQTWQFDDGDMYVRSDAPTARTLYLANSNTGAMHLDVEGSIIVGGTVDGVDVAALYSAHLAHVTDSNVHHARVHSITGGDHTASGLTAGHVLRASGATTFAFAQLQHGDLGGITADQHHDQVHGLDSGDHTGTLSWSKVNKSGSSLADLATRNYSDLQNRGHSITGSDHTAAGLTAGHVLRASGATTFAFAQLQHGDLGGVTADQHHTQVARHRRAATTRSRLRSTSSWGRRPPTRWACSRRHRQAITSSSRRTAAAASPSQTSQLQTQSLPMGESTTAQTCSPRTPTIST